MAFTDLVVFGDSLSDLGNAYALLGDGAFACPPHWCGRRCNGPLWVERLAAALRLPPLRPSRAGGSAYACGGARSGEGCSPKGMPNLLAQVQRFLADGALAACAAGPRMDSGPDRGEVLVVLRAGANDYLDAPPSPAIGEAVNRHLLDGVARLAEAGLRCFLVPSELPWGHSPIELPGLGEAERAGINALVVRQNNALRPALQHLASRLGLTLYQPDFHALFLAVRADPLRFGFTEIERPALRIEAGAASAAQSARGFVATDEPAALQAAPEAQGYLWWDNWAHLSAAFHQRLADAAEASLSITDPPPPAPVPTARG